MKLTWVAYCPECRKTVYESPNGDWVQRAAEKHSEETEHKTLIGFWARTGKEERGDK